MKTKEWKLLFNELEKMEKVEFDSMGPRIALIN